MKYVSLQISSPRSGFNLYVEPKEAAEIAKHFNLTTVLFKHDTLTREGDNVSIELIVTGKAGAEARALVEHGQYARASMPPTGRALALLGLPDFGMIPAKLWLMGDAGRARLEFSAVNLPRPISRSRAHADEPASAPEAPKSPTVSVLISIGGRDMMFNLPIEQAFATALEWTEAGYKEAA